MENKNLIEEIYNTKIDKISTSLLVYIAFRTENGETARQISVQEMVESIKCCDQVVRSKLKQLKKMGWLTIARKRTESKDAFAPSEYNIHVPPFGGN